MYNIILCCTVGMSLSLLSSKMNNIIKTENYPFQIQTTNLYTLESMDKEVPQIILLTPQVKYAKREINRRFKDVPILDISMKEYGTMDAKGILEKILKELS